MCGIVGYVPGPNVDKAAASHHFARLFHESTVRGRHTYGIGMLGGPYIDAGPQDVFKAGPALSSCFRSFDAGRIPKMFQPDCPTIAHARYSTSGDWRELENAQPIVAAKMMLVFNGVIHMGTKAEFEQAFNVHCGADNDGEVFLRRLEAGEEPDTFLSVITGSFAGLWFKDGEMYAARNGRRPLWRCYYLGAWWFTSTRDIFRRAGFPSSSAELLEPFVVWRMAEVTQ